MFIKEQTRTLRLPDQTTVALLMMVHVRTYHRLDGWRRGWCPSIVHTVHVDLRDNMETVRIWVKM